MRAKWLVVLAVALCLTAGQVSAAEYFWGGQYSWGATGMNGTGTDVTDSNNWVASNGTDHAVPTSDDAAVMAIFGVPKTSPLQLTQSALTGSPLVLFSWADTFRSVDIGANLTVPMVKILSRGNSWSGTGVFNVKDGFAVDMTGANPMDYSGYAFWWPPNLDWGSVVGSATFWGSIHMGSGSALKFSGESITLNPLFRYDGADISTTDASKSYPGNQTTGIIGGDTAGLSLSTSISGVGTVEFTRTAGAVALADPGNNYLGNVQVGVARLVVRGDQTWTNPSGLGFVTIDDQPRKLLVSSSGGGNPNMGQIPLVVTRPWMGLWPGNALELGFVESSWGIEMIGFGDATNGLYGADYALLQTNQSKIAAGTYGAIYLKNPGAAGNEATGLDGDVTLSSKVVLPGDLVSTVAAQDTVSLRVEGRNYARCGSAFFLNGYALTAENGIKCIYSNGSDYCLAAYIDARGGTVNCNGDLIYDASGTGSKLCGISGNSSTIINLKGSFITNAAPVAGSLNFINGTGGSEEGLSSTTMNLMGGSVGTPNTFEITDDPAKPFGAWYDSSGYDSWYTTGVGNVNVGNGTTAGHVQLVDLQWNSAAVEILWTNNLQVKAASSLDVNGKRIDVNVDTTIDATGSMDLSTNGGGTLNAKGNLTINGLMTVGAGSVTVTGTLLITGSTLDLAAGAGLLSDGDQFAGFVGIGDQTAVWATFQNKVEDSTNPTLTFVPALDGSGNTVWQAVAGGGGGTLTASSSLDFNWVYQNSSGAATRTAGVGRHKSILTVAVTDTYSGTPTYTVAVSQSGAGVVIVSAGSGDLEKTLTGSTRQVGGVTDTGVCTLHVTVDNGLGSGAVAISPDLTLTVRKLGDVNGDGNVTSTDKTFINGKLGGASPPVTIRALDVNGDGNVTSTDKTLVNGILAGSNP